MERKIKEKFNQSDPYPATQDWDLLPFESRVKISHAHHEMRDAEINLIAKEVLRENVQVLLSNEHKELHDNKRKLKKHFMAAEKVITDNKASMFRFNEKIKNYNNEQLSLEEQIANTKLELAKYPEIKEKMEKYVREYSYLFKDFLEKVAQNSTEFNSVHDILERYKTLERCRQECINILKTEMEEAASLKKEMMNLIAEKSNILKKLENSQTTLEIRHKQAFDNRHTWDNVLKRIQSQIADKITQSAVLKEGCYDLYLEVSRRRKAKQTVRKEDIKKQLNYIQNSILFYKEVLPIATVLSQNYKQPGVKNEQSDKSISKSDMVKHLLLLKAKEGKLSVDESSTASRKTMSVLTGFKSVQGSFINLKNQHMK